MAWLLGIAVGGVKLRVAEDDVERAVFVIQAHDAASIAEEDWQSDHADDDPQENLAEAEEQEIGSPIDNMVDRGGDRAVSNRWLPTTQGIPRPRPLRSDYQRRP